MRLGKWMTSCPEAWAEDFGIWEKAVSWVPAAERESRHSELGEAKRICALRAPRVGWVENWRCKSSLHRKSVSLSPHLEKPLNSKRWIKVSYLNQFRVFGFLYMFMNILWALCLFHISVSWLSSFGNFPSSKNFWTSKSRVDKCLSVLNGFMRFSFLPWLYLPFISHFVTLCLKWSRGTLS